MDGGRRTEDGRTILGLFADILEYPWPGLVGAAQRCAALVAPQNPEAGALLRAFCAFVEHTPLGRLEEVYTGTFDLDAACHPYVGYHLFGESYKRSLFLLELKERYRAHGFIVENELPDHLAVLLRFLAQSHDTALIGEILQEALVPALERMTGKAPSAGYDEEEPSVSQAQRRQGPYHKVLEALRLVLQEEPLPCPLRRGTPGT
jgi:nitrate reductase molybdenum cofactor assembly chaperone